MLSSFCSPHDNGKGSQRYINIQQFKFFVDDMVPFDFLIQL